MVFPMQSTVPSAAPVLLSQCVNPDQLKTEIGKQFAPLWKVLAEQLKVLFPEEDDEGVFFLPALDARSQILSIKDCGFGIGKPFFQTCST